MLIIPAIDLKDGRCVRLEQGRADLVTTYADDPAAMAVHWQAEGGRWLHVVDLDGAFEGRPVHGEAVRRIVDAIDIPVELGGGIRDDSHIAQALEMGVQRVILGTRACEHPDELAGLVDRFGSDRIAVGIDARDGWVQTRGWVETTRIRAQDLAVNVAGAGVNTILYTDTSRDGMLQGVNAEQIDLICGAVDCTVIASGGVTSTEDVKRLVALDRSNLAGVIVGKALYDGTVTMAELIAAT